jgi:hypothetical protein
MTDLPRPLFFPLALFFTFTYNPAAMVGSRKTIALAVLGLLALALRVWAVVALPGDAPFRAILWLQCLAGTAVVLAVAWLGWSLLPERPSIGWLAAVAAAVFPPHVEIVARLRPDLWLALTLMELLAVIASPRWRATGRGAAVAGCLAGLLALFAPSLALLLPIFAVAFWLAEGQQTWLARFTGAALGRVALMVSVAAIVISSAMTYHRIAHGQFAIAGVITDDSVGSVALSAVPICEANVDAPNPERGSAAIVANAVTSAPLARGEKGAASEPFQRVRSFLLLDEDALRTRSRLCLISMVAWLVLTFVGLWASHDQWRELWPTYAIFAVLLVLQTLGVGSASLRTAVEPVTLIWASAALAPLLGHFARRQQVRIYRPGEQLREPSADSEVLQGPHFDLATARRRAG